jgi:hypothetical protein
MKLRDFLFRTFLICMILIVLLVSVSPVFAQPATQAVSPPVQTVTVAPSVGNLLGELVGLSIVIFAFVAWLKQMGVSGNRLTLSAFAFGLIFGVCDRYALSPLVDFSDWFWAIVFGLMAGFLATGAYKGGQSIAGNGSTLVTNVLSTPLQSSGYTVAPDAPPTKASSGE